MATLMAFWLINLATSTVLYPVRLVCTEYYFSPYMVTRLISEALIDKRSRLYKEKFGLGNDYNANRTPAPWPLLALLMCLASNAIGLISSYGLKSGGFPWAKARLGNDGSAK
jgi:hypothetical protein